MQKRTSVAVLMLISIILINLEVSGWWSLWAAVLTGLSMTFAVNILFDEIEKR